ncbi:cerebellin-2 [Esox lucius]|uniref:cerebellin-2 n=1 Tax=Esox lucius TaxID=8010 RepID=UPI000577581B|nr:cerebellin-2 [Esox lucius]
MRGVHVLPVLLLLCQLGTSEDVSSYAQKSNQPDMWSELKDLRDIVNMQKAELAITRSDIQDIKRTAEELKTHNSVMAFRLASVEVQLEAMNTENTDLLSKLTSAQSDIERLQKENTERPKVAFSTSLGTTGSHGPFNTATTVVYRHVFSNTGSHYNINTGVFTAPVKGLYHFTFTMGDFLKSTVMGLTLFKNGEAIIHSGESGDHQRFRYASNGVIIPLEKGDVVFMQLPENYRIYDDSHHRNTFNGMLLYTL